MAKLTIGDRTVTVDDSFRDLSPEQQQATVEEIASSLNISPHDGGAPQPDPGALRSGQLGIEQGASFGFSDEIAAGLMTPIEAIKGAFTGEDSGKGIMQRMGDAYDRNLSRERQELKAAEEHHPVAKAVGNVAGGLATGGALSKGGATLLNVSKPTVANMVGRGAAEGAAYGAAYGLGEGEGLEDRLNKARNGAIIGGVTGGVLGAAGARGAQRAAEKAVPDSEALKAASNALYKEADEVGLVFKPQSFAQGVDDIAATVAEAGIDKTIHPRATAALQRLEEAKGQPLKLKEFDTLRRVIGAAAKSNEPDERRIASIMIDKLDDYLDALPASEVVSGNPKAASALINKARETWSTARKADTIEEIYRRIDLNTPMFSGSGRENAIRSEFRNLAKRKDFKRMFKPSEQKLIERVAKGGPVENAFRWLGKLTPTGVVSGAPTGAALLMGEPATAAAIAGAGMAGRSAATAITNRNARNVDLLIRNGGVMPTPQQLTSAQRALMEGLLAGGATQAPDLPLSLNVPSPIGMSR